MIRTRTYNPYKFISGAIAGGVLAAAASYLFIDPGSISITLTVLGFLLGGAFGGLISNSAPRRQTLGKDETVKIPIREEQLDIIRKRIKMGEVDVHSEVINEEKTITVPVTREELVIRKKMVPGLSDEPSETIRIPISEEEIEIKKHKVLLNDVSVYKHNLQEIKHISESLKKEQVQVDIAGDPDVVQKDIPDK
jgi:uncharacterized protein (TIGR02271 family)